MNVVLLPALASLTASVAVDGFPCLQGPCLLGWVWSLLALTMLSAWGVQRWQSGRNGDDSFARLVPVAGASSSALAAIVPQPAGVAPPSRAASPRADARLLVAAALGLRAPPTTDMAVASPLRTPRNANAGRSSPSRRPDSRSPGTPTEPAPAGPPGQLPPA